MATENSQVQNQTLILKYGLVVVVLIALLSWLFTQGEPEKVTPKVIEPTQIEQPIQTASEVASELMELSEPPPVETEIESQETAPEPELIEISEPEQPETLVIESEDSNKAPVEQPTIIEQVDTPQEPEEKVHYSEWLVPKLEQTLIEPALLNLLNKEQLIENFVVFIDNAAIGAIAKEFSVLKGPTEKFSAKQPQIDVQGEMSYVVDENSYQRYNGHAQLLTIIPTDFIIEMYDDLRPDIEDAYQQIGYADNDFNEKVLLVIDQLLQVPVLEAPPELLSPSAMYVYKDESLEQLSDIQKLLLRMGPKNIQKIQQKLKEVQQKLTAN